MLRSGIGSLASSLARDVRLFVAAHLMLVAVAIVGSL
jgi:hypothetical protein